MGLSYEAAKKHAWYGFRLLLVVTLAEVAIALVGNGHVIEGFHLPKIVMIPLMILLSLFKAYFIVKEFMHMGYEVRGLAMSVVLPTLLLVWAIIAFLWEGGAWGSRRVNYGNTNGVDVHEKVKKDTNKKIGLLNKENQPKISFN